MPATVSPKVSQNSPARPNCAASSGAATRANANMSPMLMPTSAMALVRTLSRVWSASSAVTAADTAPAPCSAPAQQQAHHIVGQCGPQAAHGKHQQPGHDDALAPEAVGRHAQRQLEERLCEPVHAHGQAHQGRVVATGVLACLQRKNGQHQEQAKHAQRKDQRQADAGAALLRSHGAGTVMRAPRCGRGSGRRSGRGHGGFGHAENGPPGQAWRRW
jgi:hypothetical protein